MKRSPSVLWAYEPVLPTLTKEKYKEYSEHYSLYKNKKEFDFGPPLYNAVYFIGDDLDWIFRTQENNPWFSRAEIDIVNAPYTALYKYKNVVATSYNNDLFVVLKKSKVLFSREDLYKSVYFYPKRSYEYSYGGYLHQDDLTKSTRYPIELLQDRFVCRKQKDYKMSDEIRSYLVRNGMEIKDTSNGTWYYYEE